MKNKFILCGLTGWCMEIMWTGMCSMAKRDHKLSCNTSFWMFPIYGMASLIGPVSRHIRKTPLLLRGMIYTAGIYVTEYATGSILKRHNACPWDYSGSKYNYKGLIRLDFAPLWFMAGLLFERLTTTDTQ